MMVVVAVIVGMIVMGIRRMGIRAMRLVVVFDGIAAWIARMRTEYGNKARENGAQQRQKDDCLNH